MQPQPPTKGKHIYVIGPPGSGKGTLCKRWASESSYRHISVGDHLRERLAKDDKDLSTEAVDRIRKQELLSTTDIINTLIPVMQEKVKGVDLLIDGFPRTFEQSVCADMKFGMPERLICLECPREIAKERYLTRALPGRDADPAIFDKRYNEYMEHKERVLDEWRDSRLLMVDSSRSTEESYAILVEVLLSVGIHRSGHVSPTAVLEDN